MQSAVKLCTLSIVVLLTACTTASYEASGVTAGAGATLGGDRKAGARVFAAQCASCHGAGGSGGGAGPSLRGESRRMGFATAVSWIEEPEPPMPRLYPSALSDGRVRDVAAYVESL